MKNVNVCGIEFKLVEREPNGRGDGTFGTCDSKLGIITIDKQMPEQILNQTIIHEWLHGVLDMYGIEQSETLVNTITNELYRLGFRIKITETED